MDHCPNEYQVEADGWRADYYREREARKRAEETLAHIKNMMSFLVRPYMLPTTAEQTVIDILQAWEKKRDG